MVRRGRPSRSRWRRQRARLASGRRDRRVRTPPRRSSPSGPRSTSAARRSESSADRPGGGACGEQIEELRDLAHRPRRRSSSARATPRTGNDDEPGGGRPLRSRCVAGGTAPSTPTTTAAAARPPAGPARHVTSSNERIHEERSAAPARVPRAQTRARQVCPARPRCLAVTSTRGTRRNRSEGAPRIQAREAGLGGQRAHLPADGDPLSDRAGHLIQDRGEIAAAPTVQIEGAAPRAGRRGAHAPLCPCVDRSPSGTPTSMSATTRLSSARTGDPASPHRVGDRLRHGHAGTNGRRQRPDRIGELFVPAIRERSCGFDGRGSDGRRAPRPIR